MEENNEKTEKVAEAIRKSRIVQRLRKIYPIDPLPTRGGLITRIQLRTRDGELIDVLDIPTNPDGFVHIETVIELVVTAWESALDDPLWRDGTKRIRRMAQLGLSS